MRRTVWIFSTIFAMLVTFQAFIIPTPPLYSNLKILPKNISRKQLDSVMDHFSNSLGVKCTFCHVRNETTTSFDFASDSLEHKKTARSMMRLTNNINRKYFSVRNVKSMLTPLEITCNTCHNGRSHPSRFPETSKEE